MPPTPFHPTHTTPFKSSISSSQQPRKRAQLAASQASESLQWPVQIAAADLVADDWAYLAEGGRNLLLRYNGVPRWPFVTQDGRRIALRLTKTQRDENLSERQGEGCIDPCTWREDILAPALKSDLMASADGLEEWLPALQQIEHSSTDDGQGMQRFIAAVADRIEARRPLQRRKAGGLSATRPEQVFATEDLGAHSEGGKVIAFEIKPKCGFLPHSETLSPSTAAWKTRFSRYRMHQIHRSNDQSITQSAFADMYDPLDLYSKDSTRVRKASEALFQGWTNNANDFNNLRVMLNGKLLVSTSSRSEADATAKQLAPDADDLCDLLSTALGHDSTQQVLSRLVEAQARFDPIDIEGLEQLYQKRRGKSLADASDEPPITIDEYRNAVEQDAGDDVRIAIAQYLLSATFKDCSLFIRCTKGSEGGLQTSVHLVDLDPKPVSKLPHYYKLDQDIVQSFKTWAANVGIEV